MIYAPVLEIICIWIAALSITAAIAIVLAILVARDKGNRYICNLPSCQVHAHTGELIRLTTPPYFDEYGFGRDVVAEPVEKDPYLEFGEAEVEMLLS